MKTTVCSLLGILALAGACVAGPTPVATGKEYKQQEFIAPSCFADQEWQLDLFGTYADGNSGHVGLFGEHGWGGGVGINYFFSRYVGIGAEGYWLAAREEGVSQGGDRTAYHNVTGSLVFRYPIESACLAPYLYLGGGAHFDGDKWASAHGGLGLEYRMLPNRFGVFGEVRWTYLGDRYSRDDLNFALAKLGFRFIF